MSNKPRIVKRNGKPYMQADFIYDEATGCITFAEPFKLSKKWWQFWKKNTGEKIIIEL
jgi:hypothetical protein